MTNATVNPSARELAQAWLDVSKAKKAKREAVRAELLAQVKARVAVSRRKRWERLEAAMEAEDVARITYYAATGDARKEAAKALPKAAKPEAPATEAPAKPKAEPKAEPEVALPTGLDALAQMVASSGEAGVVAFLTAVQKHMAK